MPSSDLPAWKAQLGEPSPVRDFTRLGLLFQLRTLTHAGSQWTAPKAETATSVRPRGTQRLAVRPVTLSATDNWVTGDVSWTDLPYRIERLGLDPRQVAWFSQFHALSRGTGEGYKASEPGWLYLDDIASPLIWPLLRSAAEVGVALVSGKRATDVLVGDRASVTVVISHDKRSATALRLDPQLSIDDEPMPATGVTGDHGVYSCRFEKGLHVTLAPASSATVDTLSWDRTALRIPSADVAEFWRDYYPDLAQRLSLRGEGLVLPDVTTETVLIVEFHPRDVVTTRWELHTGRRRVPLEDPPFAVAPRFVGADAAAFVTREVPGIVDAGVRVETIGTQPDYRELNGAPALRFVRVEVEGHNDWLELGFAIVIGDYTVAFADVFTALSRGRKRLLMVDKTWLSLHHPVFDMLRELIEDGSTLREWETGALVPPHLAAAFEPFEDLSDESPDALAWRAVAGALTSAPPPVDAPAALAATLRPYQLDGFRHLAHLHEHGLGGILADDMGLGKTLQTIALMLHAGTRFLVVAPTSVVGTWEAELARFAPSLHVATVRSTRDPVPSSADVVIVSYAVFRLEYDRFAAGQWDTLVLDEAQYVKNPTSQVHECAEALPARVKFALSGTPMENGLLDLWAILRIVAPGLFASRLKFTDRYVKAHSAERIAELRRRIRPIMLRRTKASVATELPSKQEQIVAVDLEPEHRALYDRYLQRERQKLLGLVDDLDRNRFIVFRSLTLLRRLALDPRLIDAPDAAASPSAKLDELLDRIDDLASEGHRALVFSQFTSYLALVKERLDARGIAYEYLDGATTARDRVISRFRDGEAPVFLISLKAGGVGLTLTEADYVFLLDPWWNPAAENQAIDRTHRIGQDKPVFVYRLVARDTIEEKVLALGEKKRALFDEVIDEGAAFAGELTADDVRGLLS